jgi:hypothetical protein
LCAIEAAAACSEFVEPDGRGKVAFGHQCAECAADGVAGIEALSAIRDVRLVGAEIVEAAARSCVPEIRDGGNVRHIAPANGIEFLETLHGYI